MNISEHEKPRIIAVLKALNDIETGSLNNPVVNVADRERCQNLGLTDGDRLTKKGENYLWANGGAR